MTDNEKQQWKKFQEAGLLWWVNRILHLFGWVIILAWTDDGKDVVGVWPERTDYRGFSEITEEWGFNTLTRHLKDNIDDLVKEVDPYAGVTGGLATIEPNINTEE